MSLPESGEFFLMQNVSSGLWPTAEREPWMPWLPPAREKKIEISVTGPLGEPVLCQYGLIEKTKTAIIEMSGAAGITLVPASKRNPLFTTTYGVGEVIRDAIEKGCSHFIIGIGGSATNDGGAGMLQALGFSLLDKNGTPIRSGALGLKRPGLH